MKPATLLRGLLMMLALAACSAAPSGDGAAGAADGAGHPRDSAHTHQETTGDAHDETHDEDHGEPRQTTIPAATAVASGIRVEPVGAGVIADEHEVRGLVRPIDGRVAMVVARFPGAIRSLRGEVGDTVRSGQVLATVDSNLSLSTYSVRTPIGGVITARNASLGGAASEGAALFEVADLSQLWVDLHIFGADAGHIGPGVPVSVTRISDALTVQTTLERVLPGMVTASQSAVARATLDNDAGLWRPGAAVKARITVDRQPVKQMVPLTAVQTMDGGEVVFVRSGDTYRAQEVEIGMRDSHSVEVVSGLREGDLVVVAESYLIKADIEKSGAAHDH